MRNPPRIALPLVVPTVVAVAVALVPPTAGAAPDGGGGDGLARTVELAETTRLADRRALVSGERAYAMGDETGLYPATGWHIKGEMGGFWSQPIKLLDGIWFAVDGAWLGGSGGIATTRYARGWGYQRFEYAQTGGLRVDRVELVPRDGRATLVGLTLTSPTPRDVRLATEAHSELMPSYPWGWTTPSASGETPDSGTVRDGKLVFTDKAAGRDYAAVVGTVSDPVASTTGPGFRGPQEPPVICPTEGPVPARCDDSGYGRGAGGRLEHAVSLTPNRPRTVWFAVAGSDKGERAARSEFDRALRNPAGALRSVVDARRAVSAHTSVDLPGDELLARSVEWSKQNLADSTQSARDLAIRDVDEGRAYPAPAGRIAAARWSGAGFPDYPWLFATDGEYTAHALVAAGMADVAKDHLRALRDVSDLLNARSGKVVHEVVPTGDVYFGANDDAGNTDETVKFPSAVALLWRWTGDDRFRDEMYDFAVRNLRYVQANLDVDGDGWPEGLGNVERSGMGAEKLDSTVYYVRGLLDLATLADSRGDTAVASWARGIAEGLRQRFDATWWDAAGRGYAESIDSTTDPTNDNTRIFQRHWTGLTPMEAELPGGTPLAGQSTALVGLDQRERPCYTGDLGLFHTGTGPTSAPAGNPGPSCDEVVSTVPSERAAFSLNTAVMAVAEGNYGRLAQQRRYTTANARIQLDPTVWELPGAMPEVAPSPDFVANIDRHMTERSMVLQAWGTYGVLWPVVHQQLGVAPDLGNRALAVVPQIPAGQSRIAGRDIRLGGGSVDVSASRDGRRLGTTVSVRGLGGIALTVGAVLPEGASVEQVRVNGSPATFTTVRTARGIEVRVAARGATTRIEVILAP